MMDELKDIQIPSVAFLRKRGLVVVNPMTNMIGKVPKSQRPKIIAGCEKRGWERGQCDVLFLSPTTWGGKTISGLAIELKIPDKDPFRIWKGAGADGEKTWYEMSDDSSKEHAHVHRQLGYLLRASSRGFIAAFLTSAADVAQMYEKFYEGAPFGSSSWMDMRTTYLTGGGWAIVEGQIYRP